MNNFKTKIVNGKKMYWTFRTGDPNDMLMYFKATGGEYYVRETDTSVSFICRGIEYFYSLDNRYAKGLFLIRMVKKDFKNAAKTAIIDNSMTYRQSMDNPAFKVKKTRKVDINHAYWQIAYNKGYITENTYNKGLELRKKDEFYKSMYCMALSSQGIEQVYEGYEKDKELDKNFIVKPIVKFRDMYADIRNTTYMHMDKLAHLLGNDFKSYNVDEIEFKDTKKNYNIVSKYLTDNNLTFKTT